MEVGRIFVCQPSYGAGVYDSHRAFWVGHLLPGDKISGRLNLCQLGGSLLANCFNQLWCGALNLQMDGVDITHFAMLHNDVTPEDGWLGVLLEDLRDSQADLVSAVVPIKDPRGLTSTAIDSCSDPFQIERRLTLAETSSLPPVFTAADCGFPDRRLLVNTGCWICQFNKPWRFQPHFEINDRIVYVVSETGARIPQEEAVETLFRDRDSNRDGDGSSGLPAGRWMAEVNPEDWNFSRQIQDLGCKVVATRRVRLLHTGSISYNNYDVWGEMQRDENLLQGKNSTPISGNGQVCGAANGDRYNSTEHPYSSSAQFPGVQGWLSDAEGRYLASLATGKRVLEIGSYKGLSTLWLASKAAEVTAVDTFTCSNGESASGMDTFDEFTHNLTCHGVQDKVTPVRGRSPQAIEDMIGPESGRGFDLVFIDAAHDYLSVRNDARAALRILADDGLIVFHDYGSALDKGVTHLVNELLNHYEFEKYGQVGTVAAIRPRITGSNFERLDCWINGNNKWKRLSSLS